ncbi:hypothetical protein MY4824_008996 [Beauveria thailandica]
MLLSPHHHPSIHQTITHLASLIVLEGLLPRVIKSWVPAFFLSPPLLSREPRPATLVCPRTPSPRSMPHRLQQGRAKS